MLLSLLVLSPFLSPSDDLAGELRWGSRLEWADDGPLAREHAAFVVVGRRALLMVGSGYAPYGNALGDAWAFDLEGGGWTELTVLGDGLPAGGSRRAVATERGVFLHGGYGAGMEAGGGLWRIEVSGNEVVAQEIEQVDAPPARALHGFTCDPSGELFVVFAGASEEMYGDLWLGELVGDVVHWREIDQDEENGPGPRFGFAFALDTGRSAGAKGRGRLLVCGGQVPGPDLARMATARDLWALDLDAEPPEWELLAEYTDEELPGRRNPAFAFDPDTGDLLVWGGTGNGATPLSDLFVVRTRAADAPVERLPQADGVPARASCFGVVDTRARRALLGFGNDARGTYRDLTEVELRPGGER